MAQPTRPGRLERRKARTRDALISAAMELIAGPQGVDVSVQQITDRADVGVGSFYNHFQNKAELFDAAIAAALEQFGSVFDAATDGLDDTAEVFATGVRLTVHLAHRFSPVSHVLVHSGFRFASADSGLAPRALRDLTAAQDAGRLSISDLPTALACTAGSVLGALSMLMNESDRDADAVGSELAVNLLRMFGLTLDDARAVATTPLRLPPELAG
ncbi:TetR/AcrR family transcriptional regulator [Williamsia deligens]|uniref:TetR/AcrR family transcriptional regulator n=1 Tax=Williamsia deligens TaxID=321325 RepID=A0ABW3G674_9NOCA|nr:TetR/AcrR family transcriptional regulator [Williamsia deligens]MCP2193667.1 transcriptional regulator, TetR family [Williamsia deligens]